MATGGRPRILDEVKRREFCAMLAAGCEIRTAAAYVCCSVRTIRREMLREPEFGAEVRRAEISGQIAPLSALRKAAKKNWRAAAWLLERTNPDRYGRKNQAQMKPEEAMNVINRVVDTLVELLPDEEVGKKWHHKIGKILREARRELLATAKLYHDPEAELAKSHNASIRLLPG